MQCCHVFRGYKTERGREIFGSFIWFFQQCFREWKMPDSTYLVRRRLLSLLKPNLKRCTVLIHFLLHVNIICIIIIVWKPSVVQEWPEDALTVVAERFLADVNLSKTVIKGCVEMCKNFHITTRTLSTRFLAELKRNNWVTPTSYLELISTYKNLLNKQQEWVLCRIFSIRHFATERPTVWVTFERTAWLIQF